MNGVGKPERVTQNRVIAHLDDCASGISMVNIDNMFGAGYLAAIIARRIRSKHH